MTAKLTDFVIHLAIGISVGSLTGLIEDYPLPWIVLCIWIAVSIARQK